MATGRQTKLTTALQESISRAVRSGVGLVEAAAIAGIDRSTVLQWMQRGDGTHPTRPPRQVYVDFVEAITRAKAADEARRIARIEQAGRGGAVVARKTTTYPDGRVVTQEEYAPPDWRADAFHLERHYPDKWGRRDRVDLRLAITAAAERVAAELGLSVDEVLSEATALLAEVDHARA